MSADEKLIALLSELTRENAQLRELVKNAADRMLALAAPMQQTARASEDMQALALNEIREIRLALQTLAQSAASQAKDLDDLQREVTGAHQLAPAGDDTDRMVGHVVRAAWSRIPRVVKWAGGLATAGGAGAWIHSLFKR